MKSCITKHGLGSFRAPVIQVKVVFPGEAHASVNLDSAIAHRAARVARVKLGDGNSSGGIRSVVLESPGRVVNRGTGALRFEVHVGAQIGRASCRERGVDLGGRRIIKKKKNI